MPLGIPHSRFLAWNPDDQDKALAYQRAQNEVCTSCGTRREDWVDEHGYWLDPPKWEPVVHVCKGCAALDTERRGLSEAQRDNPAVRVVVAPFDPDRPEAWEQDRPADSGWGDDVDPEEEPAP